MLVACVEETLRGVAQRLDIAADLERRDALHIDLDALARDRVGEPHLDLTDRQLQTADLVDQRQHERAAAHDDLDALVVDSRHELAPFVTHLGAARSGHDQRLVRVGDAVPARDVEDEQRDDDDRDEHQDRPHPGESK